MPLVHHELCFGCGRTNLFGLLTELAPAGQGRVTGRCFIKQDHQGWELGAAHLGLIAAALIETMSLAGGERLHTVQVEFEGAAPVGAFLELEGSIEGASASAEGRVVARARASYG